jgi:hypothetical protein
MLINLFYLANIQVLMVYPGRYKEPGTSAILFIRLELLWLKSHTHRLFEYSPFTNLFQPPRSDHNDLQNLPLHKKEMPPLSQALQEIAYWRMG